MVDAYLNQLRRWQRLILLLGLIAASPVVIAATAEAEQIAMARELIDGGQSEKATALLEKLESSNKGDPVFNYVLGIARLESDQPERAIRSFERVLANGQDFAGLRLDMGRAYFSLGKFADAKRAFQLAAKLDPPPEVGVLIDKYLTAIRDEEKSNPTKASSFLEVAAGYDSNVTSIVDDIAAAVFATYGVPGFKPSGSAVIRSSATFALSGGGQITRRISEDLEISAGIEGRDRRVVSAMDYSSQQADARFALGYSRENELFRGVAFYQDYRQRGETLGATADRHAAGVNAEWRHTLGDKDQFGLFGIYHQQRFRDLPINDVDSSVVGASWLRAQESAMRLIMYGSLFAALDDAKNVLSDGTNVGRNSRGIRFNAQVSSEHDLDWLAGISYTAHTDRSAYARSSTVDYGRDRVTELTFGMIWRTGRDMTIRPQITYANNRSNLEVSEYKRTDFTVALRYDFQ